MMKKAIIATLIASAAAQSDVQAMIAKIQTTPGVLWTAGKNAKLEGGALKVLAGVTPQAMAKRAEFAKSFKQPLTSMAIPESFDSETNWPQCAKVIGDIRDQSMCGCCWAFGAASAASDRLCIATNATAMVPLSAQDVCFGASDDGCQGGDIESPWDFIQQSGAVTGGQYQGTGPFGKGLCQDFSMVHCHHHGPQGDDPYPAEGTTGCPQQTSARHETKCDAAAKAPHDNFKNDKWSFSGETGSASGVQAIQEAIMAGGPVETAFTVYMDFANYVSGVYHHVTGGMEGGHAVRIVGWGVDGGVKYWKVANSWNPHWGEKGYFRIKMGECGIDDQVTFSPANAKWSQGAAQSDSQAMIAEIQNTPGVLWTAGKTTVDAGALKILAGVKPEAMAKRAEFARSFKHSLTSMDIPESFDSEANWPHCAKVIGDIRDQSMCGCCWAFGAASAASDRLCIATNATAMVPLSAQDVCFGASEDGCQGGDIQSPWDFIQEKGVVTGGQYQGTGPFGKGLCQDFSMVHCHHHGPQGDDPYPAEGTTGCPQQTSPQHETACDSAAQAPHADFNKDKWSFSGSTTMATGVQDIQKAIMAGGPVETAFTVYMDFANYVSGVYHHVTGGMEGGHAVRIVGWGVDGGVQYWKVANSWNPHWGEKGYFRIKMGECGIDDQVTFSPANAKWSQGAAQSNVIV